MSAAARLSVHDWGVAYNQLSLNSISGMRTPLCAPLLFSLCSLLFLPTRPLGAMRYAVRGSAVVHIVRFWFEGNAAFGAHAEVIYEQHRECGGFPVRAIYTGQETHLFVRTPHD